MFFRFDNVGGVTVRDVFIVVSAFAIGDDGAERAFTERKQGSFIAMDDTTFIHGRSNFTLKITHPLHPQIDMNPIQFTPDFQCIDSFRFEIAVFSNDQDPQVCKISGSKEEYVENRIKRVRMVPPSIAGLEPS